MRGRYGTDYEFDELAELFSQDESIENPDAMANTVLRYRYEGNPPPRGWQAIGGGRHLREEAGSVFELGPGLADDGHYQEPGWFPWTLRNDGDPVACWQFPKDDLSAASRMADVYIDVWRAVGRP